MDGIKAASGFHLVAQFSEPPERRLSVGPMRIKKGNRCRTTSAARFGEPDRVEP